MSAPRDFPQAASFIDILGFSEIVKQSGTDTLLYDSLVKTLSEIEKPDEGIVDPVKIGFQYQTFSDSIVLSSQDDAPGLFYLFMTISTLTIKLLQNKLLVRGAIAKGDLYHNKGIMFGPAFLEAYQIEKTIAKYPRIIVSKEVYEDQKNAKRLRNLIRLSEDGPPFLDVFEDLEFLAQTTKVPRIAKTQFNVCSTLRSITRATMKSCAGSRSNGTARLLKLVPILSERSSFRCKSNLSGATAFSIRARLRSAAAASGS